MSIRQIVLDTETTGLSTSDGHRITEIGCVELINRRITGTVFQTYINPERELDIGAAKISGLSLAFLKNKPKFIDVVTLFFDFIKDAELIIHNAPFDVGFLNYELSLINHPITSIEKSFSIIDTLTLARQLHPGQKNNLDALCKRYNVDNSHREHHGALLDSEILATVYLAMTSGQSELSLYQEISIKDSSTKNPFKKGSHPLVAPIDTPIIQVSQTELQEHAEYLEYIKTHSAGKCLWETSE